MFLKYLKILFLYGGYTNFNRLPKFFLTTPLGLEKSSKLCLPPDFPIPLLLTPPNGKLGLTGVSMSSLIPTPPETVFSKKY